ncbi:hypothetical protein J14TS2_15800 [Bacillus sp. J14TS2]|uniref:hypothetical protein n=1 Tax=Bacillus sp. J14TS2 TaxID=2807188 RepID=UPI001B131C66|nr:hypothetical protein [Bacillus sp. J14TS2]GIN71105.1 hypothetical protein J14TS2_15800 [Bacillus sp. J14TS2]
MNLTTIQQSVFLALNTEWQTPKQIADQVQKEDLSIVNQAIIDLMHEGLVQTNPVVLGTYRLTTDGSIAKSNLRGE